MRGHTSQSHHFMKTRLSTVFAVAVICFALLGCGERRMTVSAPPQSPSLDSQATQTATRQPSLDDLAREEAKRCFASIATVEGDSWLTQTRVAPFDRWDEYKSPQFFVTRSNTAADKLNGYDYRGKVSVTAVAIRQTSTLARDDMIGDGGGGWLKWKDGNGESLFKFEVSQQNGVWSCSGLEEYRKPDAEKMPPRPR